jgi:hypothetical protein
LRRIAERAAQARSCTIQNRSRPRFAAACADTTPDHGLRTANDLGGGDAGAQYLTAALTWLRLRLAQAGSPEAGGGQTGPGPNSGRRLHGLPGPAFRAVAFEQETLLLYAASELDPRIDTLCAAAQDDASRAYPTFALALSLFDEPAWDVLSPERPLRYWRLLEIHQPGFQPLLSSPLRADERVVHFLKGLNSLDDRLTPLLRPAEPPEGAGEQAPSQQSLVDRVVADLGNVPGCRSSTCLGRTHRASAHGLAVAAGLGLRRMNCRPSCYPRRRRLATFARLWQRETLLLPVALYLDAHAADRTGARGARPPWSRVSPAGGVIFLAAGRPRPARSCGDNRGCPAQRASSSSLAEARPDAGSCPPVIASSTLPCLLSGDRPAARA